MLSTAAVSSPGSMERLSLRKRVIAWFASRTSVSAWMSSRRAKRRVSSVIRSDIRFTRRSLSSMISPAILCAISALKARTVSTVMSVPVSTSTSTSVAVVLEELLLRRIRPQPGEEIHRGSRGVVTAQVEPPVELVEHVSGEDVVAHDARVVSRPGGGRRSEHAGEQAGGGRLLARADGVSVSETKTSDATKP